MSNEFVEYEKITFTLPDKFPSIRYSTLVFQRLEPFTAIVKGEIFFDECAGAFRDAKIGKRSSESG